MEAASPNASRALLPWRSFERSHGVTVACMQLVAMSCTGPRVGRARTCLMLGEQRETVVAKGPTRGPALPNRFPPCALQALPVQRRHLTMPSGIEFRVHPLVLLNLSDHYTRCVRQRVRLFGRCELLSSSVAQLQGSAGHRRAAARAWLPLGHAQRTHRGHRQLVRDQVRRCGRQRAAGRLRVTGQEARAMCAHRPRVNSLGFCADARRYRGSRQEGLPQV